LLGLPGAMALVALQGEMLTLKRVARLAVIEVYRIDDLPPLARVTRTAVVAQFPFVRIGVTGGALRKRQPGEPT